MHFHIIVTGAKRQSGFDKIWIYLSYSVTQILRVEFVMCFGFLRNSTSRFKDVQFLNVNLYVCPMLITKQMAYMVIFAALELSQSLECLMTASWGGHIVKNSLLHRQTLEHDKPARREVCLRWTVIYKCLSPQSMTDSYYLWSHFYFVGPNSAVVC